jgi:hypothetical protein
VSLTRRSAFLSLGKIPSTHFFDPRAVVQPEILGQLKSVMISVIEAATFRLEP